MPLVTAIMEPMTTNAGGALVHGEGAPLPACSRARRSRRLVCISAGVDPDQQFRQSIRERLADGRLFKRAGVTSFGSLRAERIPKRDCANRCEFDFQMAGSSVQMVSPSHVEGRGDRAACVAAP